jgi:manganese oxidase
MESVAPRRRANSTTIPPSLTVAFMQRSQLPLLLPFGALLSLLSTILAADPPARGTNAIRIREPIRTTAVIRTNLIVPTVTAEMGDVGGKFFGEAPDPAKTRRYYIAVEPELWDFVPEGRDVVCGKPLPPDLELHRRGGKLRYIQYTDATFTTRVLAEPRLGVLGPVLRGVVGDFIAVTLLNRASRPVSMHPHGVRYDKDSEGAHYEPRPGHGAALGAKAKFTYVWKLDANSGPRTNEPSSKAWLYHSHVRGDEDANLGLVGFIVVTDPARARADGTPADVDREMGALFMMFDESGEENEEDEAAEYANLPNPPPPKPWAQVQELIELGQRPAINGLLFGNLRGLEMNEGERVRWYLFGLGSEEDFHTAHWHGLTVLEENYRRTDVVELLPASMKIADMLADNPGAWLFHCHVAEHMTRGMFANMVIHPKNSPGASREPSKAFFGMQQAQTSLRIKRAEAVVSASGDSRIRIEGECTVYQAFSVFTQPMVLQVGERSVSFKVDRRGQVKVPEGEFQVKNASEYGVVYGGLMQFEATLTGAEWINELRRLGLPNTAQPAGNQRLRVPVRMQIGRASHEAKAEMEYSFR